jgi:hypothetical protein
MMKRRSVLLDMRSRMHSCDDGRLLGWTMGESVTKDGVTFSF